jgi:predicted phage tail protein
MDTPSPSTNTPEESPPEDEFERVQRIRAARQRAMLFAVVGAVVVAFSIFVAVGFLLPDEQATGLWAAIGVGLTVGVALRFFLGPKEREFDPVASSPEIEVSQQDKDEWRRAMAEGASPAADSAADQADDDVLAEMAKYRRRVRRLWAARVTSVIAGLVVSGALIAIFRNVAVGDALPAFMGCIAAGTVTMVLLHSATSSPSRSRAQRRASCAPGFASSIRGRAGSGTLFARVARGVSSVRPVRVRPASWFPRAWKSPSPRSRVTPTVTARFCWPPLSWPRDAG